MTAGPDLPLRRPASDDPDPDDLASMLRVTVLRLSRRLRNMRSDTTLSLNQLAVLGALRKHGPRTPRELAEHERVQPPSMTRILAGLEESGLVTRTPHPSDGRQVVIDLTAAAHTMLDADRQRRNAWLETQLALLTSEEVASLQAAAGVLDRLGRA